MYVKRKDGVIVGAVKWPHPDFSEEVDERNADYIVFQNRKDVISDIPDNAELWDMLKAKGTLKDSDRKKK